MFSGEKLKNIREEKGYSQAEELNYLIFLEFPTLIGKMAKQSQIKKILTS